MLSGVKHVYKEVALDTAGSQLNNGTIEAMIIYAAGGKTPPPWLSQASLAVDWVALNPSAKELAELKAKGFGPIEVSGVELAHEGRVRSQGHADAALLGL